MSVSKAKAVCRNCNHVMHTRAPVPTCSKCGVRGNMEWEPDPKMITIVRGQNDND